MFHLIENSSPAPLLPQPTLPMSTYMIKTCSLAISVLIFLPFSYKAPELFAFSYFVFNMAYVVCLNNKLSELRENELYVIQKWMVAALIIAGSVSTTLALHSLPQFYFALQAFKVSKIIEGLIRAAFGLKLLHWGIVYTRFFLKRFNEIAHEGPKMKQYLRFSQIDRRLNSFEEKCILVWNIIFPDQATFYSLPETVTGWHFVNDRDKEQRIRNYLQTLSAIPPLDPEVSSCGKDYQRWGAFLRLFSYLPEENKARLLPNILWIVRQSSKSEIARLPPEIRGHVETKYFKEAN